MVQRYFAASVESWIALGIAGIVWIGLRAVAGLYDSVALPPPEELRRVFISTAAASAAHFCMLAVDGRLETGWKAASCGWAALVVLPWFARIAIRSVLIRVGLYGAPAIVLGAGSTAAAIIEELRKNREHGLYPVAAFDDDRTSRGHRIQGVPVLGGFQDATEIRFPYHVEHALVAVSDAEPDTFREVLSDHFAERFTRVHVTPGLVGLANLWVQPRAIGPLVTLEYRTDRLTPVTRAMKRALDLSLGGVLFVLALPVIGLCALCVRVVSPGPAFFAHVRRGFGGRLIRVWKIRTMVRDAEERLEEHLRENSSARREWAQRVKLDDDPRVIPGLGRFLRRWSLDELPQLWNVLTGSMSLVGPRPFPEYHLELFPQSFREFRSHVPPGVTGLWQITYRTDGDLGHQQAADSFYLRNWSVWLDIWILLRTVRVVFSGSGI